MTIYLNWRGPAGRETVDEFTAGVDAPTGREFRRYVAQMESEYAQSGMSVYQSSRPCKGWSA